MIMSAQIIFFATAGSGAFLGEPGPTREAVFPPRSRVVGKEIRVTRAAGCALDHARL